MRSDLYLAYGTWILCLATTALVGCGADTTPGSSGSASGSSGGVTASLCTPKVSGTATSVEIVLKNMGPTDLGYLTSCGLPWNIETPDGSYAPAGVFSLLCEQMASSCPLDCNDNTMTPVPAGTSAKFTWDGVLYEPVDAAANECPAMNSGADCPKTCRRRIDAPPGMYTVAGSLSPGGGQAAITKTATIMYPSQTTVELVFP